MISTAQPKFDPRQLRNGGYVLYFRHGSAELGHDEKTSDFPEWWRTTDPNLTRQLDDHGWDQAYHLGQAIRDMDLKIDHVLCSEFRRAEDTALGMDLVEPEPIHDLTPLVYDGDLGERIEKRLNHQPEPGTNTVLVAHGHVTEKFSDIDEGDAMVFEPSPEGSHYLGIIDYEDWLMQEAHPQPA